MSQKSLSRREFLKFWGVVLSGLLVIRWQKISRIFSKKDTPSPLKEARYYSPCEDVAG